MPIESRWGTRTIAASIMVCFLLTATLSIGGCKWINRSASKTGGAGLNRLLPEGVAIDLPGDRINAEVDPILSGKPPITVVVANDGSVYVNRVLVATDAVRDEIGRLVQSSGNAPLVYVIAGADADYGAIVEDCWRIRQAGVVAVGLVASRKDPGVDPLGRFKLALPAEPDPNANHSKEAPEPLKLVVFVGADGSLKLNREETGSIADPAVLSKRLTAIFEQRKRDGAFRMGTNEVEKTVTIKGARTQKYGEVVKAIDAVAGAGGGPIVMQIDDLTDK